MQEVLSQTFGRPGSPGLVEVHYLSGLRRNQKIEMKVGEPGKGGSGGPPASAADGDADAVFVDRGGAGGGRENIPIIEGLMAYAEAQQGTEYEPIFFLQPSAYVIEWPYDTPTATLVIIGPGGGGGGGKGDTLPGEDGEDGLAGAVFLCPTDIPNQRPTKVN